jgi:beta-phosphoglucomutase
VSRQARAVIFDFNGTISHDEPLLAELFSRIFAEIGIDVPPSLYFDEFAGYSDPEIVERMLERHGRGGDRQVAEHLLRRRTELYLEALARRPTVLPEAAVAVREIASRVPVAIASGAARQEIDAVLAQSGLTDVFEVVVAAEDVSRGKPDPEGYVVALERLNRTLPEPVDAKDVLVFEDSDQGLAAAVAAGMRCIVIEGTSPPDRLGAAAALVPALDWSIPAVRESLPGRPTPRPLSSEAGSAAAASSTTWRDLDGRTSCWSSSTGSPTAPPGIPPAWSASCGRRSA